MAKKMPRKLVALGASAIAAVYAAGYLETWEADSRLAAIVARASHEPTTQVTGTVFASSPTFPPAVQSTPVGTLQSQDTPATAPISHWGEIRQSLPAEILRV